MKQYKIVIERQDGSQYINSIEADGWGMAWWKAETFVRSTQAKNPKSVQVLELQGGELLQDRHKELAQIVLDLARLIYESVYEDEDDVIWETGLNEGSLEVIQSIQEFMGK